MGAQGRHEFSIYFITAIGFATVAMLGWWMLP